MCLILAKKKKNYSLRKYKNNPRSSSQRLKWKNSTILFLFVEIRTKKKKMVRMSLKNDNIVITRDILISWKT